MQWCNDQIFAYSGMESFYFDRERRSGLSRSDELALLEDLRGPAA